MSVRQKSARGHRGIGDKIELMNYYYKKKYAETLRQRQATHKIGPSPVVLYSDLIGTFIEKITVNYIATIATSSEKERAECENVFCHRVTLHIYIAGLLLGRVPS